MFSAMPVSEPRSALVGASVVPVILPLLITVTRLLLLLPMVTAEVSALGIPMADGSIAPLFASWTLLPLNVTALDGEDGEDGAVMIAPDAMFTVGLLVASLIPAITPVHTTVAPVLNGVHAACALGRAPNRAHAAARASTMLRWRETLRVGDAVCSVALPLPDVLPLTRVVSGAATHAPRDGFQTEQNVLFMTAY